MSIIDGIYEVKINNKSYKARFDFGAIVLAMEHYKKLDTNVTYPEMFESIFKSTENNRIIISLVMLEVIKRCNEGVDNVIWEDLKLTDFEIIKLQLISLIGKSLPEGKELSNNKDLTINKKQNDWNIDDMEFQWNYSIKRKDDFYIIIPRRFFKQIDAYIRFNKSLGNKEETNENIKTTEIDTTICF